MYLGRRPQRRSFRLTYLLLLLILLATLAAYYISHREVQVAAPFDVTPTPTRSAPSYRAEAEANYREGQLEDAVRAYQRALELTPDDTDTRVALAELLIWREKSAEALQQAEQAVIQEPSNAHALAVLCRAYDWEGLYADAFDACECALEIDPEYAEGYAYLAEVYADTGAWGAARENATKGVELDYQNMPVHRNMGYVYEMQGRFNQAVESYENAIFLAPKLAPLYVSAGRVYRAMGDFDEAIDRLQRVTRIEPDNPLGYDQLGWTYYVQGDYARAVEYLELAIQLDPGYAISWGHLGIVHYVMQQYEEAIIAFQRSIELFEMDYLRENVRQVAILSQDTMFDPPRSEVVMEGLLLPLDRKDVVTLSATLKPLPTGLRLPTSLEQTCGQLIAAQLMTEMSSITDTQEVAPVVTVTPDLAASFAAAQGTASLNLDTGRLRLELRDLPQPAGVPYEVQTFNGPDDGVSLGYFQPDAEGSVSVEFGFSETHSAPVEYYYSLGFSYVHLDDCEKGLPWLLLSLDIDPSPTNPAWQGLNDCPQP
jgi:tetratricopeptide (TPR) repeat protein